MIECVCRSVCVWGVGWGGGGEGGGCGFVICSWSLIVLCPILFSIYILLNPIVSEVKWEIHPKTCYYMPTTHTTKKKHEADATCQSLGAHVAVPETAEENKIISVLLTQPGKNIIVNHRRLLWLSL